MPSLPCSRIAVSLCVLSVTLAAQAGCSSAPSVVGGNGGAGHPNGGAGGSGTTATGSGGTIVIITMATGGAGGAPADAATDACPGCLPDGVVAYCGDGLLNQAGEACDDGNAAGGDGCTAACDQIEDGWACPTPGLACVDTTRCGDQRVGGGETCDDGNTVDGDGCSAGCKLEQGYFCPVIGMTCRTACGDGLLRGSEQCDDGNPADGDGCDGRCHLEPGYVCETSGACRETVCGDGVKEGTEQCDDTAPGALDVPFDGCFHCLLEPDCAAGTCKSACGDGQRFSDEACDDGNRWSGDGCSATCTLEDGFGCTDTPASTLPATKDIPVVVRGFVGLGRTPDPGTSNTKYHVDFNRHYGNGNGIFAMVKATLGDGGRPVWRWLPYKTAEVTTSATADGNTNLPAPLANCQCDESAPVSAWLSASETWSGGSEGAPVTFTLSRPPCTCSDGSSCTCDNPGHLFKDGAVANSNRRNLSTPANLAQWYTDVEGVNLTLPYTLTLSLTDAATGTYSNVKSTSATAFDPIPKSGFIAAGGETDSGCAGAGASNVSFTTETRFWFEYQGGEQFAFSGDDDTWVFINRRLVVDLGGLHGKVDGSFTLDRDGKAVSLNGGQYYDGTTYGWTQGAPVPLGLVLGEIYEVAMFQAERNQCGSNFGVTLKNFAKPRSVCGSRCGDGVLAADELCDDGSNTSTYDGCGPGCIPAPYCGDGVTQIPMEECDDGLNLSQYGGCAPGCKLGPSCGDGRVQARWGEQCDDGVNTGGYGKCGARCQYGERCGDGVVQAAYEECDRGPDNGHGDCLQNCKRNFIP